MAILPLLADCLDNVDDGVGESIIPWACPIPYFGDAPHAQVATVGINPSRSEFVDKHGQELLGDDRRLPILHSLDIAEWDSARSQHLNCAISDLNNYFRNRPYDRWFSILERILRPCGWTYYGSKPTACHLDLVPYPTASKWNEIGATERCRLLKLGGQSLPFIIRDLPIREVILNGRSVVEGFEQLMGSRLTPKRVRSWDLRRPSGVVRGFAFVGASDELAGVPLGRRLVVTGFNHNLQSSFGVSSTTIHNVGSWLADARGSLQ